MANEQNLIPPSERSPKELREMARKGGKKSGEVRRKRKAMREQAELLLSLPFQGMECKDGDGNIKNLKDEFQELSGLTDGEIDNQMAAVIAMWKQAVKNGNIYAFNSLRDLMGEKPKEVIEIHSTDEAIKELDNIIESKKDKK